MMLHVKTQLISIIIPVYNVERYLEKCLYNILRQTYTNLEIILVDDGSTDSSSKLCDSYLNIDSRVKVIHKKNGGLSDARNVGIECSNGEYIIFVDSDDIVSTELVTYLYQLITSYNGDVAIIDPVHSESMDNIHFNFGMSTSIFNSEEAITELLYQKSFLVSAWGKIYKKSLFDSIRFPVNMIFEDSAIMYQIFNQSQKIIYSDAKLYGYIHREGSITTQTFSKKDCDILKITEEIVSFSKTKGESVQKAALSYQTAAAFRIYMNAPISSDFQVELSYCQKILKNNCRTVLKDQNIRLKLKLAILLYIYIPSLMPYVYKRVDRWK